MINNINADISNTFQKTENAVKQVQAQQAQQQQEDSNVKRVSSHSSMTSETDEHGTKYLYSKNK